MATMTESPMVEPKSATPTATELVEPTTPQPASEPSSSELPDEVLQLPAIQAITAGQPPAVSAQIAALEKTPEGQVLRANAEPLMKAGFGFYRSLGGDIGVIFNQLYIHPEQLKQADKAGSLVEVAPPWDQVTASIAGAGEAHPALSAGAPPEAAAAPPMPEPPQAATGVLPAPQAASAQKSTANARAKNITPGGPTKGAKPGAGRILNNILQPAI